VEKALPQVVPSITAEAARQLFHESRLKGVAVVIVAVKVFASIHSAGFPELPPHKDSVLVNVNLVAPGYT
jgi:hypothetical protein